MKVALVDPGPMGQAFKACVGHYREYLAHLGNDVSPGNVIYTQGECTGCKTAGRHPLAGETWPGNGEKMMAAQASRKVAHDSGDGATVFHCLSGETRYLTREGVNTLAETVGTVQEVLTAPAGSAHAHQGRWAQAHIHSFGVQKLLAVTFRRNKQTKVVYATAGHRWLVRRPDRILTTAELRPEHRIAALRPQRVSTHLDHEGVRAGFVFGDGTVQVRKNATYGAVTLWGPKRDLAPVFDEVAIRSHAVATPAGVEGLRYTSGLKGALKEVPSLDSSDEYLMGWLVGYFAADGSVEGNAQLTLSSSSLETLYAVRDVCTRLGIGTFTPTSKMRKGFGSEPTLLHRMGFVRSDFDEAMLLREDHRQRWIAAGASSRDPYGWTVVSVEDSGREEEVFCAVVPGTESFVLEDGIHTGNCPFDGSGQVIARSDRSIECQYCHTCFTVQVQPQFSAFPQTINGAPVQVPGMPGQIGGPPAAPGQDPMAEGDPTMDGQEDGGNPFADDPQGDEEPDNSEDSEEGDDSSKDAPPFAKGSMLRTASGAALPFDAYLAHLAIKFADNKDAVIDRVRERNTR